MNWKENFFVIDSNNVEQITSKLYGFCISEDGRIISGDEFCPEDIKSSGRGSYILISKEDEQIIIQQDAIGSQGLYLFRKDDYFALSNSDLYLIEYLSEKGEYEISLNEEYAYHLIPRSTGVHACTETIANEVCLIERDIKVIISIRNQKIHLERIEWGECPKTSELIF